MRHTINLDCKTHHVGKDESFPILLRVSINGEQGYFNTGHRIKAIHYDEKNKEVRKGIKGAGGYNSKIDRHKVRIGKIIDDFDKKGEIVSLSRIKEEYKKEAGVGTSKCFYEFVQTRIDWEKKHSKIKKNTFKFIEVNFEKLKTYRKKLSIHDIDEKFLDEYKAYITNDLGQKANTAYHAMCFIRKYTLRLFKDGRISKNPFADFIVGNPFETDLVYLEPEELNILHDLYDSKNLLSIVKLRKSKYARDFNIGIKLQEVLRYFLLSCYTGFRHSDIKTLHRENIIGNEIVKKLIKGKEDREKTVRIPIESSFHSLMEMDNSNTLLFSNPVMECSQTNKYLMEIMKEAKIGKHITFHKARYTFAINSLLLGVKIEVVSNILGHSELGTTQRYAKVVDSLTKKEMSKWGNFRKTEDSLNNFIEIICSNCQTPLMTFKIGVSKQQQIICNCPNCSFSGTYNLSPNDLTPPNVMTKLSA